MEKQNIQLFKQGNASDVLPNKDYVSPGFSIILPDPCFPHKIVGNTNIQPWPYLRREIPHNWYVDKRQPAVGFLSRDEAHILYNTALEFKGKKALEIGCWLGWSACHLALAEVELDVVDPLLARSEFYESVSNSLKLAGVLNSVNLLPGSSPQAVEELANQLQRKWSLIFIDGDHEAPGPLNDAIICERLADEDALILFHDLNSPDVAQGLDYLKQRGWQTMVYQTMQIMGVAWRGNVQPVNHQPDPQINWCLPAHLQHYRVSSMSNNQSVNSVNEDISVEKVQEMMQQAVASFNSGKPVDALRIAEQATLMGVNVPGMHYLLSTCLGNVGRHKEALAAAKAELAINPTHRQAQEYVERLTKAISKSEIKITTQQRSWNTTLPRDTMLSIQKACMNHSYRGVPMIKNPFDFTLYPVLIWNLQPHTIIEIGSKDGGSALWLGDMLNNFGIDGHIYSIDIVKVTSVQHPRVTFMEGDGRALEKTLTPNFLNLLPRPLLVIEDADHAYETSKHVLEFFHPHLREGEYIVIEDGIISDIKQDTSYNTGPHKALKEFLSEREGEYEIDGSYCDYFGYNITWCTNGFLKKLTNSPIISDSFLNKLFHYVEQCQNNVGISDRDILSIEREKFANFVEQGKELFAKGESQVAIAAFTRALEVHPSYLVAHNYLSLIYWQAGDIQKSLQHHILAQFNNTVDRTTIAEFQEILATIRPYTVLSEARLYSLYSLAKQICLDDIQGNFVECGSYKGGSAALLAVVIKRYSLRPRLLYAFDTFEGMPDPTEADKHNGIPANLTGFGVGTLQASIAENLDVVCELLNVKDIVRPVQGLFAQTLPPSKTDIGNIALLHADGDWYDSTMDIFTNLYDSVVPNGFIQVDDYGHWEGCKKAIHEFERCCNDSFALRTIDYTGVWFQKENAVSRECNHWQTFWYLAQSSEKIGNIELAKKAARAVLKIIPKLAKAEKLLARYQDLQVKGIKSSKILASDDSSEFINNLNLREINLIVFPDWQQPEDSLYIQLEGVIKTLLNHNDKSKITALIDTSNISEDDANLILSSVVMNLLMQEDLDETDVPEVSLLGEVSEVQWKALLSRINYRFFLESENKQAIIYAGAENLLVWDIDELKN